MARYSLVMSENTYFALMKICQQERLSMGKKLNAIVNEYVETYGTDPLNRCYICNALAVTVGTFPSGKTLLLCEKHSPLTRVQFKKEPLFIESNTVEPQTEDKEHDTPKDSD